MPETEAANALFNDLTTTKVIWLAIVAACTAVVVIRGRRRRRRRDREDR